MLIMINVSKSVQKDISNNLFRLVKPTRPNMVDRTLTCVGNINVAIIDVTIVKNITLLFVLSVML